MVMKMIIYEGLFSSQGNVARIQMAKKQIEKIGGKIKIEPPNQAGMILVILILPESYSPYQIFPGFPFYPT
jgi:hypothetical protein